MAHPRLAAVMTALALALFIASLGLAPSASASFPGEDGKVAFVNGGLIWVVNADQSGPQEISPSGGARDPDVSPDGRQVVYELGRDLVVTNVDGTGTHAVTTGGHNDQFPAWSPDGKQIVFFRADDYDLYSVPAAGTGVTRLTSDGQTHSEYEPEWSPDGMRIAFEVPGCDANDGQSCVYVMSAGGGSVANLTPEKVPPDCPDVNPGVGPYGNSSNPSWSPDGTKIAFTGSPFHCQSGGPVAGHDIWVMDADGSNKVDLTPDAHDSTYDERPTWSPSGGRIAFQSDRLNGGNNGERAIVTMPAGGLSQGEAVLFLASVNPSFDPHPDWGPKPRPLLLGTPGNDVLDGTPGPDSMKGFGGDDVIDGHGGNDTIDGGPGQDHIVGGPGADKLLGGSGRDVITARDGRRDTIDCGAGRDTAVVDRKDKVRGCERVRRAR